MRLLITMNWQKLIGWLLFVAGIILAFLVASAEGQTVGINRPEPRTMVYGDHTFVIPGKVAIEWKFVDATRVWLSILSVGGSEWIKEGYHPGFTCIMSQYKPIVKQLPGGQYEITFSSDISKGLP